MSDWKHFLGYPDLSDYAIGFTAKTIAVLMGFLALFLIIAYVYNIAVTLFSSKGRSAINFAKLGNVVVLSFFLVCYIPLTLGVTEIMKLMEKATRSSLLEQDVRNIFDTDSQIEEEADETAGVTEDLSLKDKMSGLFENVKKSAKGFVLKILMGELAFDTLKIFLRLLISKLNQDLIVVFFCLGPFACLFSVLPGYEKKFMTWLTAYVTFLFVPIVFNLLDLINVASFTYIIEKGGITDFYWRTTTNAVTLILYILPFWIAGKVVGSADAGRFLSTTGQIATFAIGGTASKAMSAFSKSKYGGGGGEAAMLKVVVGSENDAMSKNDGGGNGSSTDAMKNNN